MISKILTNVPRLQVAAQEPVTEGADADAEAIFLSAGTIKMRKNVQRFELFPNWFRKDARRIKGGLFARIQT